MTREKPEPAAATIPDGLDDSTLDTVDIRKADEVLAHGRGERPTAGELSRWTSSADCPSDAISAVCERLTALLDYEIQPPLELCDALIISDEVVVSIGDLWDEYRSAVDAGEDVRWPLAPLVNAWQQRPRPVEPSRRTTDRVIPARLAMANSSNNLRLLFSPAAHTEYGADGKQLVMPGFSNADTPLARIAAGSV